MMKVFRAKLLLALIVLPLFGLNSLLAQHAHVYAGATNSIQDSKLYFVNGGNYVTNSGYAQTLVADTNNVFAGSYHGAISFASLPATILNGGPAFHHAALGSFLELKVESVHGPADSTFGLWDELAYDDSTGEPSEAAMRFTLPTGTTGATNRFPLSESDGSFGSDPFGHYHGRRFTASKPGLYTIGFRIIDTSSNGENGGPIHQPSDIFPMHFQAGVTIHAIEKTGDYTQIRFATQRFKPYYIEATQGLGGTNTWTTIWGPLTENDHSGLHDAIEINPPGGARFYRLRVEPAPEP